MNKHQSIIKRIGYQPGPTLAILAGVHGNEASGIKALKKAIDEIEIKSGVVYFIFANPEAIKKNVRQINKNLNRCFIKGNRGKTTEDGRARELMKVLDECDALLDLHSSNSSQSTPFIICEKHSFDIAKIFDIKIVSHGWDKFEPGATDGYMNQQHKVGICLECGSVYQNCEELAFKSIKQFLHYYKSIDRDEVRLSRRKQIFIKIIKAGYKKSNEVSFVRDFNDFEALPAGKIFATDGKIKYRAGKDQLIIFPRANKKVGEEIFIIGKII